MDSRRVPQALSPSLYGTTTRDMYMCVPGQMMLETMRIHIRHLVSKIPHTDADAVRCSSCRHHSAVAACACSSTSATPLLCEFCLPLNTRMLHTAAHVPQTPPATSPVVSIAPSSVIFQNNCLFPRNVVVAKGFSPPRWVFLEQTGRSVLKCTHPFIHVVRGDPTTPALCSACWW